MTTQVPNVIGPYEVTGLLGQGGMGSVHRARDTRSGRPVALKLLHSALRRNTDVVERFREEAAIQARLHHPGIVAVIDFVEDAENLGMVLELVEGRSLSAVLSDHGATPGARWAVDVATQLLAALAFAHEQGIVHRDVKPSNVIVLEVEGRVVARLMDFGIAKVLGNEKARTVAGSALGTLAYMSPEQIRSPRDVDARADLYAVGITLYQMLTGTLPFDGDSEFGLMEQIVKAPPRPMPAIGGNGDARLLEPIVFRALAKAREERFPDARSFGEALAQVRPKLTPPPPLPSPGPRGGAPDGESLSGADGLAAIDEAQKLLARGLGSIFADLRHLSARLAELEAGRRQATSSGEKSAEEILRFRDQLDARMRKVESSVAPIADVVDTFRSIGRRLDVLETAARGGDGLEKLRARLDAVEGLRTRLDALDGLRKRLEALEGLRGRVDTIEAGHATVSAAILALSRDASGQRETVARLEETVQDVAGHIEALANAPTPEPSPQLPPDLLPRLQQVEARFGVFQGFVERLQQRHELLEESVQSSPAGDKSNLQMRESIEEIVGAIRELRVMEDDQARLRAHVKRLEDEVRQLSERLG